MKKNKVFFVFLITAIAIVFTSCTGKNPLEPAIKQAWGGYDYSPYRQNMAWAYSVKYPSENLSVNLMYLVSGREYFEPYNGWQVSVFIDGQAAYYTVYAKTDEAIYNYNPDPEEWTLEYEIPFVIGNKWGYETLVEDPITEVEWNIKVNKEVMLKEDVSVTAGNFEDCAKVKEIIKWSSADSIYQDSSYYYILVCWYAPNIGLIKRLVIETDKDYLTNYSMILNKFYKDFYSASSSFQLGIPEVVTNEHVLPVVYHHLTH